MNKRGEGELLRNTILSLCVVLIFFVLALTGIVSYRNHAALWEDFYAKEIARQIDLAEPGTLLQLDVTKALGIAEKSKKNPYSLFSIDDAQNLVIVSLRDGGGRSFHFFNNAEVVDQGVRLPENHLYLLISE